MLKWLRADRTHVGSLGSAVILGERQALRHPASGAARREHDGPPGMLDNRLQQRPASPRLVAVVEQRIGA